VISTKVMHGKMTMADGVVSVKLIGSYYEN
jgi:hypothetical protein